MKLESLAVRVVLGAAMVVIVAVAAWLLISPADRENLMRRFVDQEEAAHGGTITVRSVIPAAPGVPVPLPPTRMASRPQARSGGEGEPAASAPAQESSRRSQERRPRQAAPTDAGEDSEPPETLAVVPETPPPSPPSQPAAVPQANGQSAYDLVTASRPSMGQTAASGRTTWRVLKDEGGVIWLDIVVAGDSEQHYIWEVNLQRRSVQPLSAAARNLGG